jgi:hypothetical protein
MSVVFASIIEGYATTVTLGRFSDDNGILSRKE